MMTHPIGDTRESLVAHLQGQHGMALVPPENIHIDVLHRHHKQRHAELGSPTHHKPGKRSDVQFHDGMYHAEITYASGIVDASGGTYPECLAWMLRTWSHSTVNVIYSSNIERVM